jgi:hypothetical protein
MEQLKTITNLPNEYNGGNSIQLANLGNVKVNQEFKMIMLDIKILYVNIFTTEPKKLWHI